MQTALHISSLVSELRRQVLGGRITAVDFYKKERAAFFYVKRDRSRLALGFAYHPAGYGCFLVPASKVKIDTREKPWPLFGLNGAEVVDIVQCGLDRIFRIEIRHENQTKTILFEALGPNGNIWLLDSDDRRIATMRRRKSAASGRYEMPSVSSERINPFELTKQRLENIAGHAKRMASVKTVLERRIIGFNHSLAKDAIHRAGLDADAVESVDLSGLRRAVGDIAERFVKPERGYLYSIGNSTEVYPLKLAAVDAQPERFKSLSLAVMAMVEHRQTASEEIDEQKITMAAVSRGVRKLERRLKKVEGDISHASDYEKYRKFGELLKINRDKLSKGMASIVVEDVYTEPHNETAIDLDPALSAAANIDRYFREYRKGREGLERMKRRHEITQAELEALRAIGDDLEANYDNARKKYSAEIESLLPRATARREALPRLPYKEHTLSTGLTIFVGRAGADNDRTTFEFARPYELWFHAQQCAGSHVVIKFPNKAFEPSKREIEEAAAIAAWHSKARNDSLVPVIYTQRRYVRKPRKAKPGLVTVEREKSVMVAPRKPE